MGVRLFIFNLACLVLVFRLSVSADVSDLVTVSVSVPLTVSVWGKGLQRGTLSSRRVVVWQNQTA